MFGHIHEDRGVKQGAEIQTTSGSKVRPATTFINAASVNLIYQMRPSQGAVVFDVLPRKINRTGGYRGKGHQLRTGR